MDGDYLLRVSGLPDDWMLASVVVGGRDSVAATGLCRGHQPRPTLCPSRASDKVWRPP